jgi:hypothetical protein
VGVAETFNCETRVTFGVFSKGARSPRRTRQCPAPTRRPARPMSAKDGRFDGSVCRTLTNVGSMCNAGAAILSLHDSIRPNGNVLS